MKTPFGKVNIERIEIIKRAYEIEGRMTLRRCFYVLYGKGKIKNSKSAYQSLSQIFLKARELGYLDWNIIEDRHRQILRRTTYSDFDSAFDILCKYYRKDSMLSQDNYVEVWIEKDAVAGIVYDLTYDLDVLLLVVKGFVSGTHLKKASDRFKEIDKPITILYISDYDCEGEFFKRKAEEKLKEYGCENVSIKKILLTKPQIKKYKLLINFVEFKKEQLRKNYVQEFKKNNKDLGNDGEIQVELDALSNIELKVILQKELDDLVDSKIAELSDTESLKEVEKWKKKNLKIK